MFKKKQAKKLIFDPKIAMRTERSDPARKNQFCADFLNVRLQCSQLLRNCAKIKAVYRRARGERGHDIAQTIGPNCSMTHSPGKIEYNCRYFLMTFRKQIRKNKFSKNDFHTLSTGYYVSPPIDQYLKFKNHCCLISMFSIMFTMLLSLLRT
jgi:hypothetical protein